MKVRWWMFIVIAAVAAWFVFADGRSPVPPAAPPAATTAPKAPTAPPTDAADAPATDAEGRREADAGTPVAAAPAASAKTEFDPSPPAVPGWLARLRVVDDDEKPIADAEVTIWPGNRVPGNERLQRLSSQKGNMYSGHAAQPLLQLHAGPDGRAQATLALEACFASAQKQGVGRSAEVMLWHERADKEIQLVIEAGVQLRGTVLRADGTPAVGATVVAAVNGFSSAQLGQAPEPEPTTADNDGRFAFDVRLNAGYRLDASIADQKALSEMVWIHSRAPPAVTLRFPGGITIDGLVVDASGKPVPDARVRGWREYRLHDPTQDPDDNEQVSGKSDAGGHFTIAVRKHARYQLVAGKDGFANSALTWVETTEVRPHADVRLELLAMARIAGRVLHGDGSPFASVAVGARPEHDDGSQSIVEPSAENLFGKVAPVRTDADGRFELAVAPTANWNVFAQPVTDNWRMRLWQRGVAAGRDDVEIRFGDDDLAGCVVRGTVERTDGRPLETYHVEILDFEDGKHRSSSAATATIDGPHFTLQPLPRGGQFAISVQIGGPLTMGPLAPTTIGPFATDRAELALVFRLQPWGSVTVRVLAADGTAAKRVRVMPAVQLSQVGYTAMPVDAEGRVSFPRLPPGPCRVQVFHQSLGKLCEQDTVVTAGSNPELTIRLPR